MWTRGLARFARNRNNGLLRTGLLAWTFLCANARRVARILSKQSFAVRVLFEWSTAVLAQADERRQRKKGELKRRAEDVGEIRSEVGFSVDASPPLKAMQTKMPGDQEQKTSGEPSEDEKIGYADSNEHSNRLGGGQYEEEMVEDEEDEEEASSAGSSRQGSPFLHFSPMTHENDTQRHEILSSRSSHTPIPTPPFSPARPTIVRRLDLRYKLISISGCLLLNVV